jgi:hypothetical protein
LRLRAQACWPARSRCRRPHLSYPAWFHEASCTSTGTCTEPASGLDAFPPPAVHSSRRNARLRTTCHAMSVHPAFEAHLPTLCSLAIHEASSPARGRSTGYARPPGWLLEGGRLTGEQLLVPGRRRSWPGSPAVSVGATPLGPPGQPSRSPPASSAMTWFVTRSCSACASQSWPGAYRHHQPADQLLPP